MDTLVLSRGKQERMALTPVDEDARLVAAAQHRRVKFVALYDKYFSRVYRYIVRRVGVQQEAEDLTSLVFIEAMESLDNYREQGSFAGWLFSIARRKVVDHYRRSDGEILLEMTEGDDLASMGGTLESLVIHNERLHRLAQELQILAPAGSGVADTHPGETRGSDPTLFRRAEVQGDRFGLEQERGSRQDDSLSNLGRTKGENVGYGGGTRCIRKMI